MDGPSGDDRVVIRFGRRWIALYLAVGTIILVVLRVGLDSGEPLVDYPLGGLSFWIGLRMLLHPLAVVDAQGFAVWGLIVGRERRVDATRLRTDGRALQYLDGTEWKPGFRNGLAHPADWTALERWLADRV